MKLALMRGDLLSPAEMRPEGFEAVQMFFGWGADEDAQDPSAEEVDKVLQAADIALAAMTLHVDLVGPKGASPGRCRKAGALRGEDRGARRAFRRQCAAGVGVASVGVSRRGR